MADVRLPDALQAALDAEWTGGLRRQASGLSDAYRAMRPSNMAVAGDAGVAAYLAARMPATYAAVAAAIAETVARADGFAPVSLLDAGAGPGTASWAAVEALPGLERIALLDHNRPLLEMAGRLAGAADHPALAGSRRILGSLLDPAIAAERFDLVIGSYAVTELADDQVAGAVLGLWGRCEGILLLVEPGRPRDYARLMAMRAALFSAGAVIVAPCPHERPCPLPEGDWCHFGVRLPRRRMHREAKGASLGYEDEKFSYLAVARPGVVARPAAARIIRPPVIRKFGVELPLCAAGGLETRAVAKRDGEAFRAARKLAWGDGLA